MHLQDPRTASLVRLWHHMFQGARKYVLENGFIGVHNAPELVGIAGSCESVDSLFKVDFFGEEAYLTQSDQLYLEMLTPALGKVYAEIQSFRAEDVVDERHLCQFSLFEIEHLGGLDELIANLQGILQYAVDEVLTHADQDLQDLGVTLKHHNLLRSVASSSFDLPRMTYTDAVRRLRVDGFPDLVWGDDLKAHHEAALADEFGPMIVSHYNTAQKFFNMRKVRDEHLTESAHGVSSACVDNSVVASCDLILPFSGESAGAAEREHEYEKVVTRLKSSPMYKILRDRGVKDEDFDWYLDAHKDKDIPLHSGAGIGMARVAQFILGASDIREAVPFVIARDSLL